TTFDGRDERFQHNTFDVYRPGTQHVILRIVEHCERVRTLGVRPPQSPRNAVQYVLLPVGEHPVLPATVEQHVLVVPTWRRGHDPLDGLSGRSALNDGADELAGREPRHAEWAEVGNVVTVT